MNMIKNFTIFVNNKELIKRISFTIFVLFIYIVGINIPYPGITYILSFDLSFSRLFPLSKISDYSLFSLGITPFIMSYILIFLLKSKLKPLSKLYTMGQNGKRKLMLYTLLLTLLISIIDSVLATMNKFDLLISIFGYDQFTRILILLSVFVSRITGTMFLIWLAMMINERGLGNGFILILSLNHLLRVVNHFTESAHKINDMVSLFSTGLSLFFFLLIIVFLLVLNQFNIMKASYKKSLTKSDEPNSIIENFRFIDFTNPKELIFIFSILYFSPYISIYLTSLVFSLFPDLAINYHWVLNVYELFPSNYIFYTLTVTFSLRIFFKKRQYRFLDLSNILSKSVMSIEGVEENSVHNLSMIFYHKSLVQLSIFILVSIAIVPQLIQQILNRFFFNNNDYSKLETFFEYSLAGETSFLIIIVGAILCMLKDIKMLSRKAVRP